MIKFRSHSPTSSVSCSSEIIMIDHVTVWISKLRECPCKKNLKVFEMKGLRPHLRALFWIWASKSILISTSMSYDCPTPKIRRNFKISFFIFIEDDCDICAEISLLSRINIRNQLILVLLNLFQGFKCKI